MTVSEFAEKLSLHPFCLPVPGINVSGGYAGDLLSWVMGKAQWGDAWVTIMSNRNVAAVAQLTEVACVVLAENVRPDADLLALAQEHGVNLLGSGLSAFALCGVIAEFLRG
ncbi:MAG: hypothetical protein FWF10_06470 [Clostridiales bacterium]|nr:hypothetical protein [Clostridiales bacterium]